jgi:hypothetical protein
MESKEDKEKIDRFNGDEVWKQYTERLDRISDKTKKIYDLNTELLNFVSSMILFLDNVGDMNNWLYSSARKRILEETPKFRQKLIDLLNKHQKSV